MSVRSEKVTGTSKTKTFHARPQGPPRTISGVAEALHDKPRLSNHELSTFEVWLGSSQPEESRCAMGWPRRLCLEPCVVREECQLGKLCGLSLLVEDARAPQQQNN